MSKQLSTAATLAVFSMAILAGLTGMGAFETDQSAQLASNMPLIDLSVTK